MTDERKICPFCKNTYLNLTAHVLRAHPQAAAKLNEGDLYELPAQEVIKAPVLANLPAQNPKIGDISGLIREKLDIMLNIKIIEMLSKSPDTSIKDIATALNPQPQQPTLEQLKQYHDLFYPAEIPPIETGNQWADIAIQALPIIKEMLPAKKSEIKKINEGGLNVREGTGTNTTILKPIRDETARDTTESGSISQESGNISGTKQ